MSIRSVGRTVGLWVIISIGAGSSSILLSEHVFVTIVSPELLIVEGVQLADVGPGLRVQVVLPRVWAPAGDAAI